MTQENQKPWPARRDNGSERRSPDAFFATADGFLKSNRSLTGPLRLGTASPVGPGGSAGVGATDFGMDTISPRRFDVLGNPMERSGTREKTERISSEARSSRKDD